MGSFSQFWPFQNSKLSLSILKPIVPDFGLFGLPDEFQDGIVFKPIVDDKTLPEVS